MRGGEQWKGGCQLRFFLARDDDGNGDDGDDDNDDDDNHDGVMRNFFLINKKYCKIFLLVM